MIDFKRRIWDGLLYHKMSKRELARRCNLMMGNLHAQTIYDYLSGRSQMTARNLELIFTVLKIDFKPFSVDTP